MFIKTITGQKAVKSPEVDKSTNSDTKVFAKLYKSVNQKLQFNLYIRQSLKVNRSIKLHTGTGVWRLFTFLSTKEGLSHHISCSPTSFECIIHESFLHFRFKKMPLACWHRFTNMTHLMCVKKIESSLSQLLTMGVIWHCWFHDEGKKFSSEIGNGFSICSEGTK